MYYKYEQIVEDAKSRFQKSKKSHDWEHTQRVLNLSLKIGKVENADLEILKLASILHDIGREEQDSAKGKMCHAKIGADKARTILNEYKVTQDIIERVVHCIKTHRFRGNEKPESLEAKVLYDADKLDAIGAIGIGRAFIFAGEIGAKVHNKGVDVEKTKSYTEDDTAYREYLVKLSKVKDKLLTSEGRRIAQGRHEFMVTFFDRINREVDGEI